MISLKSVMTSPVITIAPKSVVADAMALLERQRISALVVVDGNIPVGIFTERALLHLVTSGSFNPNQAIKDIITGKPIVANAEMDIHEAYLILQQYKIRHLVVVDHDGALAGIATETDFLHNLGLEYFVSFNDVTNVMTKKVQVLGPDDTMFDAMRLMRGNSISCMVIVNDFKPVGIITERDVVRLIRAKIDLQSTLLKDVMSHPVLTVTSKVSVHNAAELFRKNGVRRLVITETDGSLAGIITETDMLKGLQSEYINLLKQVIDKQVDQLQRVRRQLDEKLILEAMMHSASDIAFVITDLEFSILYSNRTAEGLFEYSLQEVMRNGISSILEKESAGKFSIDQFLEIIQKKGKCGAVYEKKRADSVRYIEINVFGIKNHGDDIQGYVMIAKDISENIETGNRLQKHSEELEETNAALRVLLKQRELDKQELREAFQENVEKMILPFFSKLRTGATSPDQEKIIKSIENNLRQISSPFAYQVSGIYSNLTPAEIQVANLIKNGHSSKEIASLLNLSLTTVYTHRRNIRKKSGVTNQKVNLQSIFQQIG